jgi:glycosyltransferase involved in cell wall biosynthesis
MAAADIFCLPSYREGFGQVIIETAACEVPTVASRIYGIKDAIDDGNTGLLFQVGNVDDLKLALTRLVVNSTLRISMGEAALTTNVHLV